MNLPSRRNAILPLIALTLCLTTIPSAAQGNAVAPQYDTTHVYVAPADVAAFTKCFLSTFGGTSTKQVVATVTPTPSSTTSQLLQTQSGTVSLFGFLTPVPAPFGSERTGLLVKDLDQAMLDARAAGADVVVDSFPDPIGRDAVIRFPGGVVTQLYWHTNPPNYVAFKYLPENRIYVSTDGADAFLKSYLQFSGGDVTSDQPDADGAEIGRAGYRFREIDVRSKFGLLRIFATNGFLPWPYGRETTGYAVADLPEALRHASSLGAKIAVQPRAVGAGSAMVVFPGGYIAELHQAATAQDESLTHREAERVH